MRKTIGAYTKLDDTYPGYVNVSRDEDGSIVITLRGDPTVRDGVYVCGFASDQGTPGRCTPGDEHCNNYCNMAPDKGSMADRPLPCKQTHEGETAAVRLTAVEWSELIDELNTGG